MIVLKMFKVHSNVKLPNYQTKQSACFDVAFQGVGKNEIKGYSSLNKPISRVYNGSLTLSPGDRMLVPTGLILDIPEGYSVRIHARSGTSLKQGLILANSEGVIDSDYTDELYILLTNISGNNITINEGDRIAQAELIQTLDYNIEQTPIKPIPKTDRKGGFGSTGVSTITEIIPEHDKIIINIPEEISKKTTKGKSNKNASSSS